MVLLRLLRCFMMRLLLSRVRLGTALTYADCAGGARNTGGSSPQVGTISIYFESEVRG